jgi:GNAT superfamily N-acetyltransferase
VCDPSAVDSWGPERSVELAALCSAAMPDEHLSADELLAACWDDPGVVLGDPSGSGAVAAVVRRFGELAVAFLKVVVVDPEAQRRGLGRRLLLAAEEWTWDQGADELHLAGSAPFFLWPGVDVAFTATHSLVESAGYTETGAVFDMTVPAGYRHPRADGVELRRVLDDADVAAVDQLVAGRWPEWSDEQRRGTEQGTCVGAFDPDTGRAVAFACHSVNRAGWFGPTGTADDWRHRGIGLALLGQVCADLSVAGYTEVEICWIGPVGFYAAAGGRFSRVFRTYRKAKL